MTLTWGRWLALVMLALCLAAAGCKKANKNVTPENLAKIKPGMTVSEVETILGGPGEDDPEGNLDVSEGSSVAGAAGITGGDLDSMSKRRSTTKWLRWGNDKKNIRVGFDDGKVGAGKISSKGI
jgi:hypothetical protein